VAYLIFPRKWKLEGEIITHKKWKEYNETKGGGRKEEVPETIFVIFEGKFFKTATKGLRRNRAINWLMSENLVRDTERVIVLKALQRA